MNRLTIIFLFMIILLTACGKRAHLRLGGGDRSREKRVEAFIENDAITIKHIIPADDSCRLLPRDSIPNIPLL